MSEPNQLPRSFANFEASTDYFDKNIVNLNEDEEAWIISAPKDFDFSSLSAINYSKLNDNITIGTTGQIKYESDIIKESKTLLCRRNEAIICKQIKSAFHVREAFQMSVPTLENCLMRPTPLQLTKGLKERQKLFGGEKILLTSPQNYCTENVEVKRPKKKTKKRKHEQQKPVNNNISVKSEPTEVSLNKYDQALTKKKKKSKKSVKETEVSIKSEPLSNNDVTAHKKSKKNKKH